MANGSFKSKWLTFCSLILDTGDFSICSVWSTCSVDYISICETCCCSHFSGSATKWIVASHGENPNNIFSPGWRSLQNWHIEASHKGEIVKHYCLLWYFASMKLISWYRTAKQRHLPLSNIKVTHYRLLRHEVQLQWDSKQQQKQNSFTIASVSTQRPNKDPCGWHLSALCEQDVPRAANFPDLSPGTGIGKQQKQKNLASERADVLISSQGLVDFD